MNSYKQSYYISLIRIVANALMLGAVFVGMFMASRSSLPAEAGFCLWFFGITVPVWACASFLTRLVKRRFPGEEETFVVLPRRGSCFVRWRVLENPGSYVRMRCPT